MSEILQSDIRNRLLRAMSPNEFRLLSPAFRRVPLHLAQVVSEPGQPVLEAHFIESGLISLLVRAGRGTYGRVEIGMVGFEGMTGLPLIHGTDRSPHVSLVQAEGTALAVRAAVLHEAMDESRALRGILGRYAQSLIVQVGQTVYANADFNIEARLARWILMTQDRLRQDELPITHEFVASMLGVRRPGVTTATHVLEGFGLVRAQRGRITVIDRPGLLEIAGESYGLAEAEYERLLAEA